MRLHELTEAFDQPYSLKWEKSDYGDVDAYTTLPDGTPLSIMFNRDEDVPDHWMVEFHRNNSQQVTGEGDALRIFATVMAAIDKFTDKYDPEMIRFSAVKDDDTTGSRSKLYDRMVRRYAQQMGYSVEVHDYPGQTSFNLERIL